MQILFKGRQIIVAAWLAITLGQVANAQTTISARDVERLKAFIGDNDFGSSPRSSAQTSSKNSVVDGIYTVRPGDTLSEIMDAHLGDSGLNQDVMQRVIVANNRSAFRRGNPHWLMAGAALRMPTVQDVMNYVVPGREAERLTNNGDEWVRYP